MPTSDNQGKFIAKALINQANPSTIWDMGAGEGTYRDLMWDEGIDSVWIAVEIWKPYIEEFILWRDYDAVYNYDIRDTSFFGAADRNHDLAIFGDVLEHMTEDEARHVILQAKLHFRYILVSIPLGYHPQGEVNGNPHEAHLKHWEFDEMHAAMGYCMAFKGHTIGLYWWDSEEDV